MMVKGTDGIYRPENTTSITIKMVRNTSPA
jgi:hypothetical protein